MAKHRIVTQDRREVIIGDDTVYADVPMCDPRPDFIGGDTFTEREQNRRELYAALKEESRVATAFFAGKSALESVRELSQ